MAVVAAILLTIPILTAVLIAIRAVLLLLLLGLLGFAAGILLPRGGGQKTCVMLCVLLEVFQGNTVTGQLRVTCELIVFFDDLLRGATHLALGT